jgi:hypothetical protein
MKGCASMKKYHVAWVSSPDVYGVEGDVSLDSTDPTILKWFQEEFPKIAPQYGYREKRNDLNGNLTGYTVIKKDKKTNPISSVISMWLIQQFSLMGWEPFSVTFSDLGNPRFIYFRREIEE